MRLIEINLRPGIFFKFPYKNDNFDVSMMKQDI